MNGETVVKRIKSMAMSKGIKMQELYEQSGVTSGAVSQWKTGATTPTLDSLQRIADVLGTTVAEIIGEETKKPATDNGDGRSRDGLRDTDWQEIAQRLKNESASAGDEDYISLDKFIDGFAKLPPESRKSFYQLLLIVNNGGESVRGLLDNLVEVLGKSS